jgi:hypothetical protein
MLPFRLPGEQLSAGPCQVRLPHVTISYSVCMSHPLTPQAALKAFKAEGITVQTVGKWRTHSRAGHGTWGPVHGVMLHHTVTQGLETSLRICRRGHAALPGPLCHGVIDKEGVLHLVGWGRANHAGLGDARVLQAVIREKPLPKRAFSSIDGNARFYGFECINLGNGRDPWPEEQVETMVRASAALCRAHGWGKTGDTSVIGHLEWQPGKIDPKGPGFPGMDEIRKRVAKRLS